jgi:trk system potassium uptake protein TrkA
VGTVPWPAQAVPVARGVDTATSTPQESSKSHSLRGLFTRPTVRGTPNSDVVSVLTMQQASASFSAFTVPSDHPSIGSRVGTVQLPQLVLTGPGDQEEQLVVGFDDVVAAGGQRLAIPGEPSGPALQ